MRPTGENANVPRVPGGPDGKRAKGWLVAGGAATLTWSVASVIVALWDSTWIRTLLVAIPACIALILEATAIVVYLRRGPVRSVRAMAIGAFLASLIPLLLSLLALGLFVLSWAING
jgi:hypothetical protein